MNIKSNDPKAVLTRRLNLVGAGMVLVAVGLFVWLIQIQTSPQAKIILQNSNDYEQVTIYPERGSIYDRWGHLLAGSMQVYELGVDIPNILDANTISKLASEQFGSDYNQMMARLSPESPLKYTAISTMVTPEKKAEIEAVAQKLKDARNAASKEQRKNMPSLEGLYWKSRLLRSYPENSLAATVLGFYSFANQDGGQGYFGVEGKYNDQLAGSPITTKWIPRDPLLGGDTLSVPKGNSLVLTIDREVQAMSENVLENAVKKNGAQSGSILIINPRNGEILAMSSTPRMDLNQYQAQLDQLFPNPTPYNRVIGQTYEPGSTFKVLTMAAGLDSGKYTPETRFNDTGILYVGGVPIYNWNRGGWGEVNMMECMQYSINVCLASIAVKLGPESFYRYVQAFGIGHRTGIDLAGEASYPLITHESPCDPQKEDTNCWYPVNLGTNAFGQGISMTPIQLITAISAVANDGKMMQPHVLKSIITSDGKTIENPPQVIGTPISAKTARTETEMLAQSLEKETDSKATVEGYRMAGKTGTAEIPTPDGYSSALTNASFVGWGPVDDPQFLIYIWLEKPTSDIWASQIVAPVFKETVEKLVVLLNIPPDDVRLHKTKTDPKP